MIEFLSQPWPFYFSGFLIAVVMFLLLWSGKKFGISSSLRSLCTIVGAKKYSSFFDINWRDEAWNIVFSIGAILGGFIATRFFTDSEYVVGISKETIEYLAQYGINFDGYLAPLQIFSLDQILTARGIIIMGLGGVLIGFGTRWAGGCTSGHAISGLSDLQLPSLIAVIGFFIGGLLSTYFLLPHLLTL
jgi:uncharacterized membrane protein YedE/YeeE